ncbi:MAG: hydantoinase B/oxoprolinase family protein, partial [Caldilineaceae bacterium]|nr:hydantoinase B/oxoprolinase family protein [Caldilineaceae bacterium]
MDPITLQLYRHRLAGVAEEMGITLRRTAYSPNIKERLDFSCAVFDGRGRLIANAPHIPVHL